MRRSARGRRREHALQLRRGRRRRGRRRRRGGRANVWRRARCLRRSGRRRLSADLELEGGVVRIVEEVRATHGTLLRALRVRPARRDAREERGGRSLEQPVAGLARGHRWPCVHADERAVRGRGARARLPGRARSTPRSTDLPALLGRDAPFHLRELDRELAWLAAVGISLRICRGLGGRDRGAGRRRRSRDGSCSSRFDGSVVAGAELRATDQECGHEQRSDDRGSLHGSSANRATCGQGVSTFRRNRQRRQRTRQVS